MERDVCIVTGSGGLIGSEAAEHFADLGYDVIGIDNDMRRYFFNVSVSGRIEQLIGTVPSYHHCYIDIRNKVKIDALFEEYSPRIGVVIHAAAQPSHDWAAREPMTDFEINAMGTLNLLEATRQYASDAAFVFCSTNKVYGVRPNAMQFREMATRYEPLHTRYRNGIDEAMSIDRCLHSVFGASKVAADIMTQEYGLYYGMNTGVFRGGCLTGKHHAGAELHGFLSYLVHCCAKELPYTIYGYGGKQVRDNIHAHDLLKAFESFVFDPRPGEVYNIGGGQANSCSVLEAAAMAKQYTGKQLSWTYEDTPRKGDHQWWITDTGKFRRHYPHWSITRSLSDIIREIAEHETRTEYITAASSAT